MTDNNFGPVRVAKLYRPDLITFKWWPRFWCFMCGACKEKVYAFGWWGYCKCPYCDKVNAPRWEFGDTGY